jgi:hypothetical protein
MVRFAGSTSRLFVTVLAAVVAVFIVASVAGAGLGKPVITFVSPSPDDGATVASSTVQYAFTINRASKQILAISCAVSGPTSWSGKCFAPKSLPGNTSTSGVVLSKLRNGRYTFDAKLYLSDGNVVAATRVFAVAATKAESDCVGYGGTYSTDESTHDPGTDDVNAGPDNIVTFAWDCNGITVPYPEDEPVVTYHDCLDTGGTYSVQRFAADSTTEANFTCWFDPLFAS